MCTGQIDKTQTELSRQMWDSYAELVRLSPAVAEAVESVRRVVYRDGALSGKHKRLMALAIAVQNGCAGCTWSQTEHSLELGATTEEILEACNVAVSIGGTMAQGNALRVVEYLKELGKLD